MKSESVQPALRSAVGMNLASTAKSRLQNLLSPAFLTLLVPTQEKLATRTSPPGFPLTSVNIGSPARCYRIAPRRLPLFSFRPSSPGSSARCYRVTTTKVQMLRPLTALFSLLPSSFSIHRCSPNPELSAPKPELSAPNASPPRRDESPPRSERPRPRGQQRQTTVRHGEHHPSGKEKFSRPRPGGSVPPTSRRHSCRFNVKTSRASRTLHAHDNEPSSHTNAALHHGTARGIDAALILD